MFGSRHSCLEFRFRVGVRTLALHVLSLCGSSIPVLHMAADLFAGHVLLFLFCVSKWLLS